MNSSCLDSRDITPSLLLFIRGGFTCVAIGHVPGFSLQISSRWTRPKQNLAGKAWATYITQVPGTARFDPAP